MALPLAAKVLEYLQQQHHSANSVPLETILAELDKPSVSWGRGSTPPEIMLALQQEVLRQEAAKKGDRNLIDLSSSGGGSSGGD